MGFKRITAKRCLTLVGILLPMGTILHEQEFPAASAKDHFTLPELTYAQPDIPPSATNSSLLDNINLPVGPPLEIPVLDLNEYNLNFRSDLSSGSSDQLPPRLGNATNPRFTVADRKLNYELFGSGGFSFKLNLAPAYPNREGMTPMGVYPGIGISIKF